MNFGNSRSNSRVFVAQSWKLLEHAQDKILINRIFNFNLNRSCVRETCAIGKGILDL